MRSISVERPQRPTLRQLEGAVFWPKGTVALSRRMSLVRPQADNQNVAAELA